MFCKYLELSSKTMFNLNLRKLPSQYGEVSVMNIFSFETTWPISQISCGAFLGRRNESLYKWLRSHDQDGSYMVKTFENLLLQNQKSYDLETWHVASGTQVLQSLYK